MPALCLLMAAAAASSDDGRATGSPATCDHLPVISRDVTTPAKAGIARTCAEVERCLAEKERRLLGSSKRVPIVLAPAPVQLRSVGRRLTSEDCRSTIRERNFRASANVHGCFVNAFAKEAGVVKDLATGLMWKSAISPGPSAGVASRTIDDLNRTRFSGYSNWRLPTVEELLSLVEPLDAATIREQRISSWPFFDQALFTAASDEAGESSFRPGPLTPWTSDHEEVDESGAKIHFIHSVDLRYARCAAFVPDTGPESPLVLAVRSMTPTEFAAASRAFGQPR